ncbi:non-hydrolyzing UDP-N-acetylglucosamine 2-epimerase [Isoptericola sp. NPDC057191]|uniref:non-hydrolyzing UDP-N-acetylglucosamine 2-epimerase n=1 Tax=Isoptericola sp. NPDC057191 TaxID=3346041 RepID=UPI003640B21F
MAVVLGTRPEIVKLAPVIHGLGDRARVIHTGQQEDGALTGTLLDQLAIGAPDDVLAGGAAEDRGARIATGIAELTRLFADQRPSVVVVQGDADAAVSGAQAASCAGIPVVHVEAGLRSYDRDMPEELNRRVTDVLADVHCAATEHNATTLRGEGVNPTSVVVTGNTVVEAVHRSLDHTSCTVEQVAADLGLDDHLLARYALATIHRPENTDSPHALRRVMEGLAGIDAPVVLVLHPRTREALEQFGLLHLLDAVTAVPPVGHEEFLQLAAHATLLVSDSGGIQEECTLIGRPLLVVRRSTDRPESIAAGFARLVPPHEDLALVANDLLASGIDDARLGAAPSPYGDGHAAERICHIVRGLADGRSPAEVCGYPYVEPFRQPYGAAALAS